MTSTQLTFHICKIKNRSICGDNVKILLSHRPQPTAGSQSLRQGNIYIIIVNFSQTYNEIKIFVAQIISIFYSTLECILNGVNLRGVSMWLFLCKVDSLTQNRRVIKMWTLQPHCLNGNPSLHLSSCGNLNILFTSLFLNFLICKMDTQIPTSQGSYEGYMYSLYNDYMCREHTWHM